MHPATPVTRLYVRREVGSRGNLTAVAVALAMGAALFYLQRVAVAGARRAAGCEASSEDGRPVRTDA